MTMNLVSEVNCVPGQRLR